MRERKGSGFGRRSVASESKQAIKKYFLLYEGSDTEVLYFYMQMKRQKRIVFRRFTVKLV